MNEALTRRQRAILEHLRESRERQAHPPTLDELCRELGRTCSMLQIPFTPGDRLVLYTDGVTESTNRDGQELGVGGLEKYFKESARLPPRECLQAMSDRIHEFRSGVSARDDQLLLEIAYHSATTDTL